MTYMSVKYTRLFASMSVNFLLKFTEEGWKVAIWLLDVRNTPVDRSIDNILG